MRTATRIVVIEDDHYQRQWMAEGLKRAFNANVEVITSESQFVSVKDKLARTPPDAFVVDVMLPWNNPDDLDPDSPPTDVPDGREDERAAGLRIRDEVASMETLRRCPVFLYTVLDASDLPVGTVFVPKEASIGRLVEQLRKQLPSAASRAK